MHYEIIRIPCCGERKKLTTITVNNNSEKEQTL